MTGTASPEGADRMPDGPMSNGLQAPTYVPLTDVDEQLGQALLTMLARARIAAYLTDLVGGRVRLHVAADERADARTIVAAVLRATGDTLPDPQPPGEDPLAGMDTDAAFAELVSDWHVDTIAAVREAERQLRREDAEWRAKLEQPAPAAEEPVWLDEEHYIPPPPPPLPRLAAPTVGAMSILAVSILLLGLGGEFGLAANLTMLLGVMGVLVGAWMLVMRLRERRDDDDDGAVL